MPEITYDESLRQINRLTRRAEEARKAGRWQEAVDGWRAVLAHPCAHHQVVENEVLDEIHQVLRSAGRYDEAIDAKREAIAAGYRSVPDPEADIAECLLEAGRREEADALFEELRQRDPEDVWLYNSAAFSYGGVDEDEALRWSLQGIDVALATGDPDQVVMQLIEFAERSWKALGVHVDEELVARVEAFCDAWEPTPSRHRWDDLEPVEERPCGYCGFDPDRSRAELAERARRNRRRLVEAEQPEVLERLDVIGGPEPRGKLTSGPALAVAWFPANEWASAVERWPGLLDELPADHLSYSHATEARIKRIARHVAGQPMHVSPLTVEGLEEHAVDERYDPAAPEARSAYAAEILRQGQAIRWPPGRNDGCWCRSGRKYKRCCGPIPAIPDEADPHGESR